MIVSLYNFQQQIESIACCDDPLRRDIQKQYTASGILFKGLILRQKSVIVLKLYHMYLYGG